MNKTGYVQTVLGPILPEAIGKTFMHEHLPVRAENYKRRTTYGGFSSDDEELMHFLHEPISVENRSRVYFWMHKMLDNNANLLYDVELAVKECTWFKEAGGGTIVDVSPPGVGRSPLAMVEVSQRSGVNVICSTGLYIEASQPDRFRKMGISQLADHFLKEIHDGIADTDVKPGYIGEIGINDDWHPREIETLRAASIAQRDSGLSMTVHQPIFQKGGHKILDIIEAEGGDLSRVVLSHCDPTLYDLDYHASLMDRGATVQYDQFMLEFPVTYGPYVRKWLPRDIDRIRALKQLMDRGYEDQLTVSCDNCFKVLWQSYGGPGYRRLAKDLIPCFYDEGITETQLNKLFHENPKKILTISSSP